MSKPTEPSDLPFGTPKEVWEHLSPEMRAQVMQMEMGAAQARRAAHRAEMASADQQTWAAGFSTVRLLMALNAGAIVAILAFLGSMIEDSKNLWLTPLVVSLISFLVGATLAVTASAIGFFAGSALVRSLQADVLTAKFPYVYGTEESIAAIGTHNRLRCAGILACIASGFFALLGSGSFLNFAIIALQR